MAKKIVIDFDRNKVITYGAVKERHVNLAIARLRLMQMRPSFRDQVKKAVKCFFKAIKLTITRKPLPPIHVRVRVPLRLECKSHAK